MDEPRAPRKRKLSESILSARAAGSYHRTKAGNACLVCRARKTKCDNVWPICGFCKKTGGECSYTQPTPQRFDQASLEILKRLDSLERAVVDQRHECCARQISKSLGSDQAVSLGADVHSTPRSAQDAASFGLFDHISTRSAHDPSLPQLVTTSNPTSPGYGSKAYAASIQSLLDIPPGPDVLLRATEEMGIEAMLRWPICSEALHQLGMSPDRTLVELLGQVSCHIAAAGLRDDFPGVKRQAVFPLVENFLVNNNVKNPIIDPVELRRDAEDLMDSSYRHGGRFCRLLLVLAISSISTSLTDHTSPGEVTVARDATEFRTTDLYFQGAQQHMGSLFCENTLISVQCAFLSGVYLMYTMRILAAWKAFVQASTQCLGYFACRRGLASSAESDVGREAGLSIAQDQLQASANLRALEDSLYWSCLKSEIELRLELGLPGSGISGIQYPNIFPPVPNFEHAETAAERNQDSPSDTDRGFLVKGWLFYLGEIALKRMQYRVLTYRYDHSEALPNSTSSSNNG
ncbi:Fungal Zn(2)-Cys(6) binuclear cluster domain-containing protein [Penicillium ucsense]|uniref:Fungal Zn(2)-Cys(6) binuclear cluster domain-containing protein n=1 Tax=Penicillium ucsense TaxID=2839758 RepID=A0A8J8WIW7_9EURO|nr:Fungal Zn(2)-Cys(6) binuclear cluster domain-containing protein [Penicillium ucsense]KAF7734704.1 Fungal Zn(2)-Cys(6) binuclear cluster domain-containing protein [Penicillium ucsense]